MEQIIRGRDKMSPLLRGSGRELCERAPYNNCQPKCKDTGEQEAEIHKHQQIQK